MTDSRGANTVTSPLDGTPRPQDPPVPGIVVVFAGGAPTLKTIPIGSTSVELGRESMPDGTPRDPAMSRKHARIKYDDGTWEIEDLGSHNGTAVDGEPMRGSRRGAFRVLRLAHTLCLLEPDVRPFAGLSLAGPIVIGHRLRAAMRLLDQLAETSGLHIHGESGSGKELVARAFHERTAATRSGTFVAINCAAIPATLAEAMLFGARKGAYSGADRDTEGVFGAADRGTLFLDEIGELESGLQAKLLRVLESREVLPVGATRTRPIDVRVCSASHRDLRALVAKGTFREDLYFRIGRPELALPPLRERREEIPVHLVAALRDAAPGLELDASLVEVALLRRWSGNIRELRVEMSQAAHVARAAGATVVSAQHLAPPLDNDASVDASVDTDDAEPVAATEIVELDRELVLDALRRAGGRVATAARALGITRIRLRRWLEREAIDPKSLG